MADFYEPGKRHGYKKQPHPLTLNEISWLILRDKDEMSFGGYYCIHCTNFTDYTEHYGSCCTNEAPCPVSENVESLQDGMEFMRRVLKDITDGDEHDLPCSHLPKNLSCPYQTDEDGDKPCDWCNHKERLIRIEAEMDGTSEKAIQEPYSEGKFPDGYGPDREICEELLHNGSPYTVRVFRKGS